MREVSIELAQGRISATALDLGLGGVSVWAPGPAPEDWFRVELELHDTAPPLVLAARVAREYPSDGGAVWGLEFSDVNPEARARLEHALRLAS